VLLVPVTCSPVVLQHPVYQYGAPGAAVVVVVVVVVVGAQGAGQAGNVTEEQL